MNRPTPSPAEGTAAELRNIRKRFGTTVALDGATLALHPGEVHGVLGENGAGKTTLLNVLGGLIHPDDGAVVVEGRPVRLTGPRSAWAHGIGLVHQHFALVPRLTVLENLALGVRRAGGLRLPLDEVASRTRELAERTGLHVPLGETVEHLGVGVQQRVEILKVLLKNPTILALDEPTAVLAPDEVSRLLELLRSLAREGRAVAIVAHKLDEVLRVADRVTVLRHGAAVLEAPRDRVTASSLAKAMVGETAARTLLTERALARRPPGSERPASSDGAERPPAAKRRKDPVADVEASARAGRGPDQAVARLRHVTVQGRPGEPARLDAVSLQVRRGEIVGIAGVEGNGQRELARVLAGRRLPDRGSAAIPDDPGYIPQDRRREGLVLDFDLTENLALAFHRDEEARSGPFLRWSAIAQKAHAAVEDYSIRTPSLRSPVRALSGGNQQRVVVARELTRAVELLIAENPTRGLDVAGEAYVHGRLRELVQRPHPPGVVVLSTDLDEVLALSDRILVMVRGGLHAVPPERRTREGVGQVMLSGLAADR